LPGTALKGVSQAKLSSKFTSAPDKTLEILDLPFVLGKLSADLLLQLEDKNPVLQVLIAVDPRGLVNGGFLRSWFFMMNMSFSTHFSFHAHFIGRSDENLRKKCAVASKTNPLITLIPLTRLLFLQILSKNETLIRL